MTSITKDKTVYCIRCKDTLMNWGMYDGNNQIIRFEFQSLINAQEHLKNKPKSPQFEYEIHKINIVEIETVEIV